MKNPGKVFEQDFFISGREYKNLSIDRFYDTMSRRVNVSNPSDFLIYRNPYLYYFELKSYAGTYIPISAISDSQLVKLTEKSLINGVVAGVVLNFRTPDNFTYFLFIQDVLTIKAVKKGITLKDAKEYGIVVPSTKKRTRFRYIINEFLDSVERRFVNG